MVYPALATGLVKYPVAVATALTVVVVATAIGPAYRAELVVGGEPSVV